MTTGSFGQPEKTPTFDKSTSDQHYKETYNNQKEINFDQLSWFSKVEPPKLDITKALGKK